MFPVPPWGKERPCPISAPASGSTGRRRPPPATMFPFSSISSIQSVTRYQEGMALPAGTVLSVRFILDGQAFVALNGPNRPAFTPAVSFVAYADTQEELDSLWMKLAEGGEEGPLRVAQRPLRGCPGRWCPDPPGHAGAGGCRCGPGA